MPSLLFWLNIVFFILNITNFFMNIKWAEEKAREAQRLIGEGMSKDDIFVTSNIEKHQKYIRWAGFTGFAALFSLSAAIVIY